jgi:hypothetical protein
MDAFWCSCLRLRHRNAVNKWSVYVIPSCIRICVDRQLPSLSCQRGLQLLSAYRCSYHCHMDNRLIRHAYYGNNDFVKKATQFKNRELVTVV